MFQFLKDKLGSWTKNLTKKAEEDEKEIKKKVEKELKKQVKTEKKSEKQVTKKKVEKELKKQGKKNKKEEKAKAKVLKELNIETEEYEEKLKRLEETRDEEEEIEEIHIPEKFNAGTKSYEPDLEKLKEIEEDLSEEEGLKKLKEYEQELEEKPKEELKKASFFQRVTSGINKVKISEAEYQEYAEELENILIENNVALEVAEKMVLDLKGRLVGKEFLKKEVEFGIKTLFGDIIRDILTNPPNLIEAIKDKNYIQKLPYVILFCGINGSGKTTTIAKVANHLQSKGISCVMAAADTFRAASIEQIKEHGKRLGINVIAHDYGTDPASVGFDAIQYAKKNSTNCVLIDTAGRMHTQKNLMKEMEKIVKVCQPDKKLFIGESITGNDAIEQVKNFNEAIGIDGIILTKADVDEKGGTALSVGYITQKPIFYLGTGQEYRDIEPFNKTKFVEKLGL